MRNREPLPRLVVLAALGLLGGCAQPGPISSRRTVMGGLKSSVSQLESDKEGLRKELADLRTEYRRLEDRYAQEVSTNNELADRLDGARSILKRQGDESGLASASGSPRLEDDQSASLPPPRRVTPSGRSKPRKAPFTEIRARPDRSNPSDDPSEIPEPDADLVPQARRSSESPWTPIAQADLDASRIR